MSTPEFKRSATLAANQVYSSLDCSHYNGDRKSARRHLTGHARPLNPTGAHLRKRPAFHTRTDVAPQTFMVLVALKNVGAGVAQIAR